MVALGGIPYCRRLLPSVQKITFRPRQTARRETQERPARLCA
jgi:hypothetical protein